MWQFILCASHTINSAISTDLEGLRVVGTWVFICGIKPGKKDVLRVKLMVRTNAAVVLTS